MRLTDHVRWSSGALGVGMRLGEPFFFAPDRTPRPESAYGVRFLFTGREYLSPLGLYDYRHRAYSPTLGRFLQVDPIADDDLSLYRYVGNAPWLAVDPDGLRKRKVNWRGRAIVVDDQRVTRQCLNREILWVAESMKLLEKIASGEATFRELKVGAVANASGRADSRYGTEGQRYLRSLAERYIGWTWNSLGEMGIRGMMLLGSNVDVLNERCYRAGMERMAETARRGLEEYGDFLNTLRGALYPEGQADQ
ncbi:MAG: RHS repeat-associated core domain-containing protein [Nitrospira sp.]|nr:RHS repeat-associated core domain-containing protein [Nitrospira sp.]